MALQSGALRTALLDAGASQEAADRAAEEAATYDNRLASIEARLAVLMVMVGALYALVAPALWLLVRIGNTTGAL